ncbi:MAG: hypothetical protein QOE77_248 [Blastocatellia bacterium]|jgi:hypothetical protein|nr:hypothetical protein [Blastocatellia bacterium]
MRKLLIGPFLLFLLGFTAVTAVAQLPSQSPPSDEFKGPKFPADDFGDRAPTEPRFTRLWPEGRVLKEGPFQVSADDRLAARTFLKQPNTGLVRLLPREIAENSAPVYNKQHVLFRGGGAYYSFAILTHYYGFGSDIELQNDHLSVGFAGAAFGMITNLGAVSLDSITIEDQRVAYLSSYRPPKPEGQARAERRRFNSREGVIVDGAVYRGRLPVQEGATYLLRSIDYERSDVLVAFHLVRKDADGSVVLTWKLLRRFSPPKLDRGK